MSEENIFETGILEVWNHLPIEKDEIDDILKETVMGGLEEKNVISYPTKCEIRIDESRIEWTSNLDPDEGEYNGRLSIMKGNRWIVDRASFSFDIRKLPPSNKIETSYLSVIFGKDDIDNIKNDC